MIIGCPIRAVLSALLLGVVIASTARAELILNADLDPSQIGPLPLGNTGIAIPLPDFTLDGLENSISIRFTQGKALQVSVPAGTDAHVDVILYGLTDGSGDDTLHGPGSLFLSDAQHQPLPDASGVAGHIDRVDLLGEPHLYIESDLPVAGSAVFTFYDVHFVGGQAFDLAAITGAVLTIRSAATVSGDPPTAVDGTLVIVAAPEPASLSLLAIGGLALVSRRRTH
ncbi:MAG: PEP-CTERM sorting domain-containing protein [Planctomycetes bacterium]|nr:PEP-CTERM sorting domain-containing protein [Planctomycetota bacterium]